MRLIMLVPFPLAASSALMSCECKGGAGVQTVTRPDALPTAPWLPKTPHSRRCLCEVSRAHPLDFPHLYRLVGLIHRRRHLVAARLPRRATRP